MSNDPGLNVSNPASFWLKDVNVNFKDLFKAVGNGLIIGGVTGEWSTIASSTIDAIATLEVTNTPSQLSWLLIQRSMARSIIDLLEESKNLIGKKPTDKELDSMSTAINAALKDTEITINNSFFDNPRQLPILKTIREPLITWLEAFGMRKSEATAIADRLPSYFVLKLNEEWRDKPSEYSLIKESINTPFTTAAEREHGWIRYAAYLEQQTEEAMFEEAFSLRKVYIKPRAYYIEKPKDDDAFHSNQIDKSSQKKIVVDLENHLETWLSNYDDSDSIRVISGGPGSGKSSFTKIFAAKQAALHQKKVLFVPLHRLTLTDDLIQTLDDFLSLNPDLQMNTLNPKNAEGEFFVIFDGLDELSMQGKAASGLANQFIRDVKTLVRDFNSHASRKIQVLISGREIAVDSGKSELRKSGQLLYLLPYLIEISDRGNYNDPFELLNLDLRHEWWQKYGEASGHNFHQMPKELLIHQLSEITAQPLLNYLVALSYLRGEINFSEDMNLNVIYQDLISSVFNRKWDKSEHPATKNIEQNNFNRVLEEISIASWHGDGRTTTIQAVTKSCEHSNLTKLFENFVGDTKEGVNRLLMAFYFRQAGQSSEGDSTFEFTHKSFGEFLIAKRIVRLLNITNIQLKTNSHNPDIGWNERDALLEWIYVCGPTALSDYIFKFLENELSLQKLDDVTEWHNCICNLLSYLLQHELPMNTVMSLSFKESIKQARNIEESLLACRSICSKILDTTSIVNWPMSTSAGAWISKLRGQRLDQTNTLSMNCLNNFRFEGQIMHIIDLHGSNMTKSTFSKIGSQLGVFIRTNLENSDFTSASLRFSSFDKANLQGANLTKADFEGAILRQSNFLEANLKGTNFTNADLSGANLKDTDLRQANFTGANLNGANLSGADLSRASLRNAKLDGVDFTEVVFSSETQFPIGFDLKIVQKSRKFR